MCNNSVIQGELLLQETYPFVGGSHYKNPKNFSANKKWFFHQFKELKFL